MAERPEPTPEERRKWLIDARAGDEGEDGIGEDAAPLTDEELADLDVLTDLLADRSTWAEPRAGLEGDVVAAVLHAEAVGGVEPGDGSPSRPADDRPLAPVHSLEARAKRPNRNRLGLAMLAAAAAVVVMVGIVVTRGGSASVDFDGQLAATALVPGAVGSVELTRNDGGFRIELDARGLEPLPDGQFYEAWLKNESGTLIPIGTFSSSDDEVTLWSGLSPVEFPTMTVTIEDSDNNQGSSGRVVLVGAIEPAD